MSDQEEVKKKLGELRIQHRDLDDAIAALQASASHDTLEIQRLKKSKLSVKDQIEKLKSALVPDIIA